MGGGAPPRPPLVLLPHRPASHLWWQRHLSRKGDAMRHPHLRHPHTYILTATAAEKVRALPTFIFFKNGKRISEMTGAKVSSLRKLIEAHM